MRTTLTLESDLALKLKSLADRQDKSFKQTVNDVIRRGLGKRLPSGVTEPIEYEITPHYSKLLAGIDPMKLNQLNDDLDAADFVADACSP